MARSGGSPSTYRSASERLTQGGTCGAWRIAREFVAAQEEGLVAQEGGDQRSDHRSNAERWSIAQLFEGKGRTFVHRLRTIE
jgi:hypothetical protein